jgi:hypothetical protein
VRLFVRMVLAVAAFGLGTMAATAAAQAQEQRTITVTPNTGLMDGQVVTIHGTGFAGIFASPLECPPGFAGRTDFGINEVLSSCAFLVLSWAPTVDSTGNLTGTAPVREVFTPTSGGRSYDCTLHNDCELLVAGLNGPELGGAAVPIRFGPETPATKADCKNGGWRNFANDQGQPFRNQGLCVAFVVSHRR